MRKILITSLAILAISIKAFPCECVGYTLKESDSISYKNSDLVLIGNVIKTGYGYQIEVVEILKGDYNSEIVYGPDNAMLLGKCTGIPEKTGKYLFYLNAMKKNGKIIYHYYNKCLASRPLNFDPEAVSFRIANMDSEEINKETEIWINALRTRRDNE